MGPPWAENDLHDYYCVIISKDPKWNPGHIPCPDYEKRNCEGCIIKDEEDRKKWYAKRREESSCS